MKGNLKKLILENIKETMVFNNPGKGTSTVTKITQDHITYMRGHSKMTVKLDELEKAYEQFYGSKCSTNDLKQYKPSVFSSKDKGHSCNCTFLFSILQYLHLSSEIKGRGVQGDPFYVIIE